MTKGTNLFINKSKGIVGIMKKTPNVLLTPNLVSHYPFGVSFTPF